MSLFDKAKEAGDKAGEAIAKANQERQQKNAIQKDARGDRLEAVALDYMGGYADHKKAKGILTFYQKQVEFSSPLSTKFTIPNSSITNIVVEGKDEVNRRVTVGRLLLVGVFAFALKKKSKDQEAYLTLELNDGQEAVFFIDKKSPMDIKTKLSKTIMQVKQANSPSGVHVQQNSGSVADEIAKLASLKDQGILTQAEFDRKKNELLG